MRTKRVWIAATAAVVVTMGLAAAAAADVPPGPELVSAQPDGQPFTEETRGGGISDDGRYVAFQVPGVDEEINSKVYLRDRANGTTTLVHESAPTVSVRISGNGRYLAELSDDYEGDGYNRLFVHDIVDGSTEYVSSGDLAITGGGSVSDSGRRVAYIGDYAAVYVWDFDSRKRVRLTNPVAPASGPIISGDGTKVLYRQYRHLYVKNIATGAATRIDVKPNGEFGANTNSMPVDLSDSGAFVLFKARGSDLAPGTAICNDGAGNQGCLLRRNVNGKVTTAASVLPNGQLSRSYTGGLSGDGRVAAFQPELSGPQVYARVLSTATTRMVSVNADGQPANAPARFAGLNQDGSLATFHSKATNFGHADLAQEQVWVARGK